VDFKEQIQKDLNEVFFNKDEFATEVTINGNEPVIMIFDEEYEVIEADEIVAIAPALIAKKELTKNVKDDDEVLIGSDKYYVADKIPENDIEIILLKR